MQSSFYADSYASSSPGGIDFFFYGSSQPVYDHVADLDPASPFTVPEVVPEVYTFTSSPYMYSGVPEYPVYDAPAIAPKIPSSASSSCGSSCGSSSWNHPAEEVPAPAFPAPCDDSGSDSPPPQSK